MRIIIIGDIHGCDKTLKALVDKVKLGKEDKLVFLGDLFDRGAESWEVLQTAQMLEGELGERFVLLRGNHEDYLLQPKLSLMQKLVWERVGRRATITSFKAHGHRMEDAIPWLKAHCQLFYRDDEIQCVHAGLMIDPIEVNDVQTLIHDHEIVVRNRYAGPLTIVGHIALDVPTYFVGDGKTTEKLPYNTLMQLPQHGIICIDTGCGKGGKLTAMIVKDGQYCLEYAG